MIDSKKLRAKRKGTARVFIRFLRENPLAFAGAVVIFISIFLSVMVPILPLQDPSEQDLANRLKPPSMEHFFGTDNFGRDVFSRVIWGGRISLMVGVFSVLLGSIVGVVLGIIAGYLGKFADQAIMRITDIFLSFPALLLAMALCAAMGSSLQNVIIAIAVISVPRFSRIVRGSALSVKEMDFIEAARALGQSPIKIIISHLFPNVLSPILVMFSVWIPVGILTEASLSFLGLGVMPPTPTWGNIIQDGKAYLQSAPWITIFSGLVIVLVVMAFNFVGDALRDAFDPRLKGEREVGRG
jgi:peptide/nickel transport system permease protein